jgi:demethylmenaquinone methyltransferase/2-methoxy-6-polyprenyl-1,4-benzoquinol methylase
VIERGAVARLRQQQIYYERRANLGGEQSWRTSVGQWDFGPVQNSAWASEIAAITSQMSTLTRGAMVLEVAAGSGTWTAHLARYATQLVAFDTSPSALDLNRGSLPSELRRKVLFMRADALRMPFRADSFDLAAINLWLTHVPLQFAVPFMKAIIELVHPKGVVSIMDSHLSASGGQLMLVDAEGGAKEYAQARRLPDGNAHEVVEVHYSQEALARLLARCGYEIESYWSGQWYWTATARRQHA